MFSLFKLQLKKTFTSPPIIFPFIMPIILTLVYIGNGFGDDPEAAAQAVAVSAGFLISMAILQTGMVQFGYSFMNVKETVLIRRIGATKLRKSDVVGAFILTSLVMLTLSIAWILALYAFIFDPSWWYPDYGFNVGVINWGQFFVGIILGLMLSYSIATLFISFSTTSENLQYKSTIYFFAILLLAGGILPQAVSVEWIHYTSLILPHVYVFHYNAACLSGANVFNLSDGYTVSAGFNATWTYQPWEAILNIFMPIGFFCLILPVALYNFTWD